MKPPARAVVGNLVWSTDGGVWAVWRVSPLPHAHTAVGEKLAVHSQLRGFLMNLPGDSMLLSVCEQLSPFDIVEQMADGIDLDTHPAWEAVCGVSAEWLATTELRRRRYYVAASLSGTKTSWQDMVKDTAADIGSVFGMAPRGIPGEDVANYQRQANALKVRLAQQVGVTHVTAGELCWLYARALRRELDEPPFEPEWEPPVPERVGGGRSHNGLVKVEEAESRRIRGVLAHLTDVVVKEGGYGEDEDRPRHRRYVRIDNSTGTAYQTVLALADMPHYFRYPNGGGEWMYHVDQVGFPVDWCVRIKAIANADAQSKVRRKHRDLVGQVDEYDGEVTGAPPQLSEAIQSIDAERAELGANPAEPELQVTVLMSVAASNLSGLEERAGALQAMFEPEEYGLARPTGGQAGLVRSMLPGTAAASVCRDYTQFMLTRDLAAGTPFCGSEVGDPNGLLLGVSMDDGNATPVLFDPSYGPKVNASPSLAAVGRLGSGKSFFLKRLCWDTVARGGQVVTIDRTTSGEYARLGEAMPGRVQIVRLEAGADTRLDPMRSFTADQRATVTLGFLSLLAGCSAHSEEGAALAEAVDAVTQDPEGSLLDVLVELKRMSEDPREPDPAARSLARRLAHYATSPTGQLAFGSGETLALDADFIVFWAPNLTLADRETMASEQAARMMLPEQVLGQAMLYLVAAVGRQVVFRDPTRFAAALYDEAWALLASPHGQSLLIEGVRDGRKHNGAIWLASQHPNDLAVSELEDLLGSKFVFRQARQAIPAALHFLGIDDSMAAAATLEQGLDTGVCLYRDVRDRVGLIQVLPPALPELDEVFNTAPTSAPELGEAVDADELEELGPSAMGELVSANEDEFEEDLASFDDFDHEFDEFDDEEYVTPDISEFEEQPSAMAAEPSLPPAPEPSLPPAPEPSLPPAPEPSLPPAPEPSLPPAPEPSSAIDASAAARERARRRRATPLAQALAEREQL